MKIKFRRSCQSDLEQVYTLHTKCFSTSDQWYKSTIKHYLDKAITVELVNKNSINKIIGILLQGSITACNKKINIETVDQHADTSNLFDYSNPNSNSNPNLNSKPNLNSNPNLNPDTEYKEDVFEPVTSNGELFLSNNLHLKELYGIVMICIDPDFRGKSLAKKLIEKHLKDNPSKTVCLNTRKSNVRAFMLYKSMGYEHIAYIKDKYFLPTEDSIYMIKEQPTKEQPTKEQLTKEQLTKEQPIK